ncbi:solute carrier family 45 member 4 [Alosa sapidissima]|uniref:solute carrier family 45 member 4 n=1 Tax=Alosa sapidissima TaxID=34773 RepID=UPI001C084FA7|nr:solute carrier family 45 member 4 [Alosa sapidissima]XP_041963057.1 solute carrier family 45 member 4 [Alosa sapidissima]XP_041963058.1 solute carrier family 45 member 4 [Alosa sapidissima]
MQDTMAPNTAGADAVCVPDEGVGLPQKCLSGIFHKGKESNQETESHDGSASEGPSRRIPLHKWVMNGAVMFGREFCYAMETALVTPVLLQIGLPEQYYSLTWFLSPVLGLMFTPVIGSASDRCTLRWGRRRPFILALCVGVLLGVALFLNGALIGLTVGDVVGRQPIGIVLTVVGVVVLDFCADASEGPIRAYLLDVADTEEQDMALNIHAFSAGLGGAVGYMLGGLNWTHTALGKAFQAQEQVLFFFASIIFIISVTLHLFSIKEQPYSGQRQEYVEGDEVDDQCLVRPNGSLPQLDLIGEEEFDQVEHDREVQEMQMDFLNVDMVRSKSDSVLAMPDATIELDPDLDRDQTLGLIPDVDSPFEKDGESAFQDRFQAVQQSSLVRSGSSHCSLTRSPDSMLAGATKARNGALSSSSSGAFALVGANSQQGKVGQRGGPPCVLSRPRHLSFYRQPSFTFSYYGRVGLQRPRRHRAGISPMRITSTRSLNDIDQLARRPRGRRPQWRGTSESSSENGESEDGGEGTTVKLLWLSMLKMPRQLGWLCLCHLFTWFSIMAEAVFYTDFMGQVIFEGDPTAAANSTELQKYHKGVQMGCWGLVVYAATAAVSSAVLQKYLDNYDLSIKIVYMLGTLSFTVGTAVMAIFPNIYVAMTMISTMGVFSMSISYCPYALLGQYHEIKEYIHHSPGNSRRGFGIDCAILSCQVYIAQILVASALGAVVDAVGTVRVIPMVVSVSSLLGFLAAAFLVIYPDTSEEDEDEEEEPAQINLGPDVTVEYHLNKPSELKL